MKKYEKELLGVFLDSEENALKKLDATYKTALSDIDDKLAQLMARQDADQQHVIYQVERQKALRKEVAAILDKMHSEEFESISDYLTECYDNGFIGTMYSLNRQGIPMCFPIDQEAVTRAVQLDSKISNGLYSRLGEDVQALKKSISAEISRGISNGSSYADIARQIKTHMIGAYDKASGGAQYRAELIARTEGNRIRNQSSMDASNTAKDMGADVVKQWDSALDRRTRPSHTRVDGEIRELDEPFSNGLMHPGDPDGGAAEVCNCRCALLQRARWAVDSSFTKMNNFTKQLETFDSPKSYE